MTPYDPSGGVGYDPVAAYAAMTPEERDRQDRLRYAYALMNPGQQGAPKGFASGFTQGIQPGIGNLLWNLDMARTPGTQANAIAKQQPWASNPVGPQMGDRY